MDSDLGAADHRPGDVPCRGRPSARERGILSAKPPRGWLLAAQARPLRPMRMQLLGTHEQTSLRWEGSQQPLLWLSARTGSGFLKQERYSQRRLGADVLDE